MVCPKKLDILEKLEIIDDTLDGSSNKEVIKILSMITGIVISNASKDTKLNVLSDINIHALKYAKVIEVSNEKS